jgi:predicted DNA-binding protein YlxM (UPF0122 family)
VARVKNLPKGEKNPRAKLREWQIPFIRSSLLEAFSDRVIARAYGVTRKAIYDIRKGKTWTHVPIEK